MSRAATSRLNLTSSNTLRRKRVQVVTKYAAGPV